MPHSAPNDFTARGRRQHRTFPTDLMRRQVEDTPIDGIEESGAGDRPGMHTAAGKAMTAECRHLAKQEDVATLEVHQCVVDAPKRFRPHYDCAVAEALDSSEGRGRA